MTQEDKKIITDELDRRLRLLWVSSSAQDEHDEYYKNPLVKQLKELAAFVSNIKESEKPNQDGLEEEMDRFFETMPVLEHENIFEDTFKNIARHFAQWGAEHCGNSEIPKDPEEAAEKYVSTLCNRADEGLRIDTTLESAFIAGYNLCKKQMMEGAAEGEVKYHDYPEYKYVLVPYEEFNEGDKVRVIIVKEEPEKGSEAPIPKTVDEAVKTLAKIVSKEDRDYLLENGAISMHDSMGRWIRNEWGLWTDSELKNELKKKGFEHPDDMSNHIIEEFVRYCLENLI